MAETYETITEDEVAAWAQGYFSNYATTWLTEILKGIYPLDKAREDVLGFREKEEEKPSRESDNER